MRVLASIIFLFSACTTNESKHSDYSKSLTSKDTTISLKDSLGKITFTIPRRFDTSFQWTHYSDDGNGQEKYRFQSKSLPINKESGWIWNEPSDSIDQLTIRHYEHLRLSDTSDNAIRKGHLRGLADAKVTPWMRFITYDSVENIDNKLFSLIAAENYDTLKKQYCKYFGAQTLLKGNILRFEYKLLTRTKDSITDNFFENTKRLIRQIRINGL